MYLKNWQSLISTTLTLPSPVEGEGNNRGSTRNLFYQLIDLFGSRVSRLLAGHFLREDLLDRVSDDVGNLAELVRNR